MSELLIDSSYSERLKASAMRVVFGKTGPIACHDCGDDEYPDLLEIHHVYEPGERNGNAWRRIHGNGSQFHKYILTPGVEKPRCVLVCPNCHSKRH